MSNGVDRRAQIDTETVKALLLINGGGAVALLAFLPTILGREIYEPLIRGVLWGLSFYLVGLIAAVMHNRYRRVCSLIFDQHEGNPPPCRIFPLSILPFNNDPPCACRVSILFLWTSILAFIVAGILVVHGGFVTLSDSSAGAGESLEHRVSHTRATSSNDTGRQLSKMGAAGLIDLREYAARIGEPHEEYANLIHQATIRAQRSRFDGGR